MYVPISVMAGLPANCHTLLYFTLLLQYVIHSNITSDIMEATTR